VGYYKRIASSDRNRNPFLKRLGFRLAHIKPSTITVLTCLVILLAGVVFTLSIINMLPENFAELAIGPDR
jgi:hypothetical protein